MYTSNIKFYTFFEKSVYIESPEPYTFFKKLFTLILQSCARSLKMIINLCRFLIGLDICWSCFVDFMVLFKYLFGPKSQLRVLFVFFVSWTLWYYASYFILNFTVLCIKLY